MPESPVSGKNTEFTKAPVGKKAMTAEEMQEMVNGPLKAAAKVLGGTVVGQLDDKAAEVKEAKAMEKEKIPEEDKKAYIRSLLAKEPFTKVYYLFGGRLRAMFRTRKASENKTLSGIMDNTERHRQRLITSLVYLIINKDGGGESAITLDDLEDISHSAVFEAFNQFEALCDLIFRRANDPDF